MANTTYASDNDFRISMTCRPRALSAVSTELPEGFSGVYQIGSSIQLDSRTVGFFINIRQDQANACDLELGSDFCFTRDPELRKFEGFQALSRAEILEPFDNKQKFLMVSYPMFAAFVPLGALLDDGTPHPHAGTGFAITVRLGRPCSDTGETQGYTVPFLEDCYDDVEILQLAWDGEKLSVTGRELKAFPGKKDKPINPAYPAPPMAGIIADGEDILTGVSQITGQEPFLRAGVARWKRTNGRWEISEFIPIGAPGSFEPSLIRDTDGSLLYTHRTVVPEWTPNLEISKEGMEDGQFYRDLRVWRSTDNGRTWTKCIHVKDCCNATPLSITMTNSGIPVIFTNDRANTLSTGEAFFHGAVRERLVAWPLNANRTGLLPKQLVRDAINEFGAAPYGTGWYLDHPSGQRLRFGDNKWHSILTMRNLDISEGGGGKKSTLYTGFYAEEIISDTADIKPPWNFE